MTEKQAMRAAAWAQQILRLDDWRVRLCHDDYTLADLMAKAYRAKVKP